MAQKVNFGKARYRFVQRIPDESKSEVWYSRFELQAANSSEIERNHQCCQAIQSKRKIKAGLEKHDLTWRGLEDERGKYPKAARASEHTQFVIHEYHNHQRLLGDYDQESLRLFAKTYSRPDRLKAQRLGEQDEKDAKEVYAKSKLMLGGRTMRTVYSGTSKEKVAGPMKRFSSIGLKLLVSPTGTRSPTDRR